MEIKSTVVAPSAEAEQQSSTSQVKSQQEGATDACWQPKLGGRLQPSQVLQPTSSLRELLQVKGLPATLPWEVIAQSAGIQPGSIVEYQDVRGEMLIESFFQQTQLTPTPHILPIIQEGAAHVAAAASNVTKRGYASLVTGAMSDGRVPQGVNATAMGGFSTLGTAKHYGPPRAAEDAPPFILVSDLHFATYPLLMPSAGELKVRGITKVVVGLENENLGLRSLQTMHDLGQPAQRSLASILQTYEQNGISVEVYGLDLPRGDSPSTLPRRIMWETGDVLPEAQLRQLAAADIYRLFDRYQQKFEEAGSAFAAQRERLEQAREEALAGRW